MNRNDETEMLDETDECSYTDDSDDSSDDDEDDDVSWLFEWVARRSRRPKGLHAEWKKTKGLDDSSLEKIFRIDFVTWVVYYNAKSKATMTRSYDGRAALRERLEQLGKEPIDRQKEIAQKVRQQINPELENKIIRWAGKGGKKRKR